MTDIVNNGGTFSNLTSQITNNKVYQSAVDKVHAWANGKIVYGANTVKNYLRQFDYLGVMAQEWTLLDEAGEKAFDFDAFLNASIKSESKVAQAPVENGSFVAYNISKTPLEISCVLAKKGFPEELQPTVDALLEYVDNTALLSIITPEHEYENMKLTKISFDRSADSGVDLIVAECSFIEIKQVTTQYTSARLGKRVNRGRQQPQETSALAGGLAMLRGR